MQPPVTRAPWAFPIVCALAVVVGASLAVAGGAMETEYLALDAAVAFSYPVVGALILTRWPRHPVGALFVVGGAGLAAQALVGGYAAFAAEHDWAGAQLAAWIMNWVFLVGLGPLLLLPLLLPDGRLPNPRWRGVLWALATALAALVALLMVRDELWMWGEVSPNPVGFASTEAIVAPAFLLVMLALAVANVAAIVVRVRRGSDSRRRLLPILVAVALIVVAVVADAVLPPEPPIGIWLLVAALPLLPIATAFSIFRTRLFDIEVGVRRTVVYVIVAAVLLAAYIAVVAVFHTLLPAGGGAAPILATAVVAVAFAPVRDVVQRAVARLLFGSRGDPSTALSRLAQRLEAAASGSELLDGAAETVAVTLRLPSATIVDDAGDVVSAWAETHPDAETETVGRPPAHAATDAAAARVPLRTAGRLEGTLLVAPRSPGEQLSRADLEVLDELARPLAVALAALRLDREVQRSRERLAIAREDERRRLRRELHDGLGPGLAAIGIELDVAGARTSGPAAASIERARELTASLVGEVRRIVHDLRPAALDELGLVGALEDLALSAGAGAGTRGPRVEFAPRHPLPPLSAAVEVAAYRIAQEAVANAMRHAGAGTVRVSLTATPDALVVEVEDDGSGMPAEPVEGVGSGSMRERAQELGGALQRTDRPGGGTIVRAELPL
ncbi:sensor histidine kinase [Agromyces sp. H66]|uniref:sensor histidine kinase n=1 Tax=Agromyces sp. H66 TaxID=2529859 RepID=UPI0010A9E07F|nr:sensor histidine kinase [Agromyces sp. H66]